MSKIIPHLALWMISLWCLPALAYIDPGSGSAIMSGIIGFFLAVTIAIKSYWYKIRSLFGFRSSITEKELDDRVEKEE